MGSTHVIHSAAASPVVQRDASAISPASGTARSDSAPSADRAPLAELAQLRVASASQAATAANSPAVEA
jgi:hypothetical protein